MPLPLLVMPAKRCQALAHYYVTICAFCLLERMHVWRLQRKRKGGGKEDGREGAGGGARGLARAGRTSINLQLRTVISRMTPQLS